jgi:hypothetical protein
MTTIFQITYIRFKNRWIEGNEYLVNKINNDILLSRGQH